MILEDFRKLFSFDPSDKFCLFLALVDCVLMVWAMYLLLCVFFYEPLFDLYSDNFIKVIK